MNRRERQREREVERKVNGLTDEDNDVRGRGPEHLARPRRAHRLERGLVRRDEDRGRRHVTDERQRGHRFEQCHVPVAVAVRLAEILRFNKTQRT